MDRIKLLILIIKGELKMDAQKINSLPDSVSPELLQMLFEDLVRNFNDNNIEKHKFFYILIELTDRQVMTYEILEQNIKNEIDHILCQLWNTDSYDDVDIILSVVVNLGLGCCFKKIKQSAVEKKAEMDKLILAEILEMIDEAGDHIDNPYYELENGKS